MINAHQQTTTFEWLCACTTLCRSGYVTDAIRAWEAAWGSKFDGDPTAVDAIRQLPEYPDYANALRSILRFPLTLYRVTTAEFYRGWRSGLYNRPVSTSLSLEFARLIKDVHPATSQSLVLITGVVLHPDAVIMRGRIESYELVVDSACVSPVEVRVLEH